MSQLGYAVDCLVVLTLTSRCVQLIMMADQIQSNSNNQLLLQKVFVEINNEMLS